jgi:hypothetical protein
MITGSLKKSGVIFFKQLYDQIKMKTQLTRTCSMQQRQFKEKSLCLRVHLLKTTERSQINKRIIKKYLEPNKNENITYQNLWDIQKSVLRRKFKAMSAYIKKSEYSQINNLMMHLKVLEKQQTKPQISK